MGRAVGQVPRPSLQLHPAFLASPQSCISGYFPSSSAICYSLFTQLGLGWLIWPMG